jgi:hypothetical protein
VRPIPEFDDASDDYARDDDARDYLIAETGAIRDDRAILDEVDGSSLYRGTRIAFGRGFEQTGLGLGFEAGHLDEIATASDDYALPRFVRSGDDASDGLRRR